MKTLFIFLVFCTNLYSQQDCSTKVEICDNTTFNGNSNGFGIQELNNTNRGCITSNERQSSWFLLNVLDGGTFTFTITPLNGTDDYDFAIWNDCPNSQPVRCSYAAGGNSTGLSLTETDLSENSLGNRFVKHLDVLPNEQYVLLVNNFTASNSPFNLTFGGTANLGCLILSDNFKIDGNPKNDYNELTIINNSDCFLEFSNNGYNWNYLRKVDNEIVLHKPTNLYTYYRLNTHTKCSDVIVIRNANFNNVTILNVYDLLGRKVPENYNGIKIIELSNGEFIKRF